MIPVGVQRCQASVRSPGSLTGNRACGKSTFYRGYGSAVIREQVTWKLLGWCHAGRLASEMRGMFPWLAKAGEPYDPLLDPKNLDARKAAGAFRHAISGEHFRPRVNGLVRQEGVR